MGIEANKKGKSIEANDITVMVDKSLKNKEPLIYVVYLILGGKLFLPKAPVSTIDYVLASWKGIPKQSLLNLSDILDIPMKDIAVMLNVSYKTLGRKSKKDLLNPLESSLSIELATVTAKGLFVFEDAEKFSRWLQKENRALSGKKPIQLLNTPTGIKLVSQILERIEQGVYT
jgi:putative toxin-antitoxin system antitoxin component (TIGR02293 family)